MMKSVMMDTTDLIRVQQAIKNPLSRPIRSGPKVDFTTDSWMPWDKLLIFGA